MRNWTVSTGLVLLVAAVLAACVSEDENKSELDDASVEVTQLGSADAASDVWRGPLGLGEPIGDSLTRETPMHVWEFTTESTVAVFFDLASREGGDTVLYLYLYDGFGYRYIEGNDDCYRGTLNSCLHTELEAGEYALVATSYQYAYWGRRTALNYHLTAHCDSEDGCTDEPDVRLCGSRGLPLCLADEYCDWDNEGVPACGAADHAGTCQPIPDACPEYLHWVCGCDGNSYQNECFAAMAGIDVSHDGQCPSPGSGVGEICGGIAGFQCQEGLECDYSANDSCLIADMAGTCRDPEDLTFCTMEYHPVCGCDGETYGNDCMRRSAGVPFSHMGACEE